MSTLLHDHDSVDLDQKPKYEGLMVSRERKKMEKIRFRNSKEFITRRIRNRPKGFF